MGKITGGQEKAGKEETSDYELYRAGQRESTERRNMCRGGEEGDQYYYGGEAGAEGESEIA